MKTIGFYYDYNNDGKQIIECKEQSISIKDMPKNKIPFESIEYFKFVQIVFLV
jgi:hypothetical protein